MGQEDNRESSKEEEIWEQLKKKVKNIQYGSANIIVHDGRIVQTEISTKIRY